MTNKIKTPSRHAVLRGSILTFLVEVFPERVEELSIAQIKYEYYEYSDIIKALNYLVDRGYITKEEIPHPARPKQKVKLYRSTSKGIDLVECTTEDLGVVIEKEV
ncbi:MAG: hypothetical protein WC162_04520 [Sphaerochaetaceae bacterium]